LLPGVCESGESVEILRADLGMQELLEHTANSSIVMQCFPIRGCCYMQRVSRGQSDINSWDIYHNFTISFHKYIGVRNHGLIHGSEMFELLQNLDVTYPNSIGILGLLRGI
jgi:hypothetical protein